MAGKWTIESLAFQLSSYVKRWQRKYNYLMIGTFIQNYLSGSGFDIYSTESDHDLKEHFRMLKLKIIC